MAEYLVIRLGPGVDDVAHWIAVDSDGARRGPPVAGALREAAADILDRKVIVLVPATDVLTTSADIPVKAGPRLQAALPYALEEYVADDVDKLHFAAGARRGNGKTPVAAVSRERMQEWMSLLRDAGIHASRLVAESYGLAMLPGTISMLLDGDTVFLNDGADIELCLQGVRPGDALLAMGVVDDSPTAEAGADSTDAAMNPAHLLVWCEPADDERYRHDWNALRHDLASVEVKLLPDGTLPRLAATVATGAGVNLLQGEFGPKKEYSGLLAPWRYAAILLVALVFVATAAKAVNVMSLGKQETALKEQFHSEYRQLVPGAPDVSDPVRLVASLQARAGTGGGPAQVLLDALEQLGTAVKATSSVSVQAISFRAEVVDVRLSVQNVSALDSIRRGIDANGRFKARIQSTDQDGERVNGRIQIQAVGK